MRRTINLFLLFMVAASGSWAGDAYRLADLEQLALRENPALRAAEQSVRMAEAAVTGAAAYPNPELEYLSGTARPRLAGPAAGTVRSTTLTQPLDLPWRRQPRIAAAEAGVQAAQAGYVAFRAGFLATLRLRYFQVLRRDAEKLRAQEDAALMEKVRSRIALRVNTGEAPRFELIKVDAEMLNAQKTAQAAEIRLGQARAALRQMVGQGLPDSFRLLEELHRIPEPPPLAEVRQVLHQHSPALAQVRAETVRAERLLDLERAQRWPALALKAGVDEEPEMRTHRIGLVLSIPLWDRRQGPVDEAAAQLARARHALAAESFSLDQGLEIAYQQYDIAEAQVTALESGIVRQAEAALKVAEAAYRFGERGFLEVLDAQRVFRAARSELIDARFELAAAWVEIERLRAAAEGVKS
ncbi:MAG: TolC family protein [Dechloromonas sp.]|nr:TolC family protein [Dechloromonas sp.]